ncbi:MAG: SusC/RagA family TonB-linked outer membrane protein [Odoribacteraceae bacterium]|jgi:TonB-linked SusC/RagA family outer membrane protein|nr:SusC/RagA family TonB-linked outer membrane protein [Odoribacteraceae bacterium]
MKKKVLYMFMLILFVIPSRAQEQPVSGKVTATDGSALSGVTVLRKGTRQGVITDALGEYKITLPGDAVLQFSFVGFKPQEIPVAHRARVDVTMEEETRQIDEIIVVAYGTAKKESFTGSVATLKADDLSSRQLSNVTAALPGRLAGVQVRAGNGQPGVTSTVRVRGIGSMSAGNAPLYVVDGVPYDGDLSSINSADIETLTVLKDAASNALYGARGANGVILITTRKAKSREAVVTIDARWGTNTRAVPNYRVLKSPERYLEKVYEAMYNGFIASKTPEDARKAALNGMSTNSDGGIGYRVHTLPAGEELIGTDGKMNPKATRGYNDGKYTYLPDDWFNELFNKGNARQEYNVSVSGLNDNLNYYLSLGYLDDTGLMPGSGFARYTSRVNADYRAKSWLRLGSKISYTRYDMQYPFGQTSGGSSVNLFYLANNIAPVYPLYVRDNAGKIIKDSRGITLYDFGDKTTGNFKRTFMSGSNPASLARLDKRGYETDVFSGRWYAAIEFVEGLKFTYNFGTDIDNTRYTRLYNAYRGQYSRVGGIVYVGHDRSTSINHQQLLSYVATTGDHSIDLLFGHESYSLQANALLASREKLYAPEVVEINNAIFSPSASSSTNRYKTEGWFARGQYEYDRAYVFSLSSRRDASSRFDKSHRWGNFGSVGAAWLLSRATFLADQSWVDHLKIKASYGIQGNDDLLYRDGTRNYYPDRDQYALAENNGDFALSLVYKGNKEITWETSHSFNIGADFALWNGRLSGTLEYFSRLTRDMLYYRPVSLSGGYAALPSNIGKISNRGVELSLESRLHVARNARLSLHANATALGNKIKALAPELEGTLVDGTTIFQEGESMYRLYFPRYEGVNDEGIALYHREDKTGSATTTTTTSYPLATKYPTGDLLPDLYGGFGFTLEVAGFDLSCSAAYQLGGQIFDSGYQALMHSGSPSSAGHNWHEDILKSWSGTNKSTRVPRVGANDNYTNSTSTRFLVSSNYLDVTNVSVGYTLPPSLFNERLTAFRAYCTVDNLLLISARRGLDPRQSYTSANAARYAPARAVSAGITLKF